MDGELSIIVATGRVEFRQTLKNALEARGYIVVACEKSDDILSAVQSDSSVGLLMIEEPDRGVREGLNGVETVRRVRALEGKQDFPVIFCSGRTSEMPSFYGEFKGTNTNYLTFPSPPPEFDAFLKPALKQRMEQ